MTREATNPSALTSYPPAAPEKEAKPKKAPVNYGCSQKAEVFVKTMNEQQKSKFIQEI